MYCKIGVTFFLFVRVLIVYLLARMDRDFYFDVIYNQIQFYMFELLVLGYDFSDDNFRELDSSEDGNYDVNQERIGYVDW